MSLLFRNTLKSVVNRQVNTKLMTSTVASVQRNFSTPAASTPAATNRGNILKDSRKRVAEYRLRKPTLQERSEQSDLYAAVSMADVSSDAVGKYVQYNVADVSPNFHKVISSEGKATDNYWLIREEFGKLSKSINKDGKSANVPLDPTIGGRLKNLHFVHGLGGTGKSVLLAQLTAHYSQNGWIVLSGNGTDVSRDLYGHIYLGTFEGREEIFEQNLKSRHLLQELCEKFGTLLKDIPLAREYNEFNWVESEDPRFNAPVSATGNVEEFLPFPKNSTLTRPTGTGKNLYDLANVGAWRCDLSGYIYNLVFTALKEQVVYPVLIVFDEVNHFDQVTELYDPRDPTKRIPLQSTSIGKLYYDSITSPPYRGSTVIATTANMNALKNKYYDSISGTSTHMCNYTNIELQGAIEHYSISKFLLSPLDIELLRRAESTTGGLPRDVYRFVCPQ